MNKTGLFDLTGQLALVTGGNGGLGRGIALGLAQAGAAVAVLARNEEKSRKVLSELKAIGAPSMAVTIDLTRREEFAPAFERVENELGAVDILVNNAGNVSLSGGVMNENLKIGTTSSQRNLTPSFFFPGSQPRGCSAGKGERSSTSAVCTRFSVLVSYPRIALQRERLSSSRNPWQLSSLPTTFK